MTPTRALRSPRPALALALLLAAAAPAAVRADYEELGEFLANGAEPYFDFGSSLSLVAPFGAAFAPTPALMAVGWPAQTNPAIQIFTSLDGKTWTYNASLLCCPVGPRPAPPGVYFALSFSGAGTRLLAGMPGSSGPDPSKVNAQVFDLNAANGTWIASPQDITCTTQPSEGSAVALSRDGSTAWVGGVGTVCYTVLTDTTPGAKGLSIDTMAATASLATSSTGRVTCAGLTGGTNLNGSAYCWSSFLASSLQILLPPDAVPAFGRSLAMSADNSTLAVGACGFGVYVYTFSPSAGVTGTGAWDPTPTQVLRGPGNTSNFGCPVALSPDGKTLAVGSTSAATVAPGDFASNGYAFVFTYGTTLGPGGLSGFGDMQQIAPPSASFNISFGGAGLGVESGGVLLAAGSPAQGDLGGIVSVWHAVATASATASATTSATTSAMATSTATTSAMCVARSPRKRSARARPPLLLTTWRPLALSRACASPLCPARSATASATATMTATNTATSSMTATSTATSTNSATRSANSTATATGTRSLTMTASATATVSPARRPAACAGRAAATDVLAPSLFLSPSCCSRAQATGSATTTSSATRSAVSTSTATSSSTATVRADGELHPLLPRTCSKTCLRLLTDCCRSPFPCLRPRPLAPAELHDRDSDQHRESGRGGARGTGWRAHALRAQALRADAQCAPSARP